MIKIAPNQSYEFIFYVVDVNGQPVTGLDIVNDQLSLRVINATSITVMSLDANNFRELGEGFYVWTYTYDPTNYPFGDVGSQFSIVLKSNQLYPRFRPAVIHGYVDVDFQQSFTDLSNQISNLNVSIRELVGVIYGQGVDTYDVLDARLFGVSNADISVYTDSDNDGKLERLVVRDPSEGFQTPFTPGGITVNNVFTQQLANQEVATGMIELDSNPSTFFQIAFRSATNAVDIYYRIGTIDPNDANFIINQAWNYLATTTDPWVSAASSLGFVDLWSIGNDTFRLAIYYEDPNDLANSGVYVYEINYNNLTFNRIDFYSLNYGVPTSRTYPVIARVNNFGELLLAVYSYSAGYPIDAFIGNPSFNSLLELSRETINLPATSGAFFPTINFVSQWQITGCIPDFNNQTTSLIVMVRNSANNWSVNYYPDFTSNWWFISKVMFSDVLNEWIWLGTYIDAATNTYYLAYATAASLTTPPGNPTIIQTLATAVVLHRENYASNKLLLYGFEVINQASTFYVDITLVQPTPPDEVIFDRESGKFIFESAVPSGKKVIYSARVQVSISSSGIYTVTLNFVDENQQPVPDVRFSVINSANQLIHSGISDVNGVAVINLDADSYILRPYKTGYNFAETQITVTQNETFQIQGTQVIYTPAPDPQMCRIHIYTADFGLTPQAGIEIFVDPRKAQIAGDKIIVENNQFVIRTDDNGYAYFDAFRGARIFVHIPDAAIRQEIFVPDKASESLANLIEV